MKRSEQIIEGAQRKLHSKLGELHPGFDGDTAEVVWAVTDLVAAMLDEHHTPAPAPNAEGGEGQLLGGCPHCDDTGRERTGGERNDPFRGWRCCDCPAGRKLAASLSPKEPSPPKPPATVDGDEAAARTMRGYVTGERVEWDHLSWEERGQWVAAFRFARDIGAKAEREFWKPELQEAESRASAAEAKVAAWEPVVRAAIGGEGIKAVQYAHAELPPQFRPGPGGAGGGEAT